MDITIDGPTFYDQEDENIFFSCIYQLPDYKQMRGHGMELTISFNHSPSDEAIIKLLVICRRWHINANILERFKRKTNLECYLWQNEIPQSST
ncbi:hypothetical protein ACJJIW_01605 [Microbulbifer sp. JMSA004]|uniref:hypothetical protein n=1 Tax=Microbulbifer sp. JMSA004 TaxID=3243370 RepID=UPI004039D90B